LINKEVKNSSYFIYAICSYNLRILVSNMMFLWFNMTGATSGTGILYMSATPY